MSPRLWLTWLALTNAAFILLGGCATVEPTLRGTVARVPIHAACVPAKVPPRPAGYADDNLPRGAANLVTRYRLGASANEARKARLAILEPVIEACRQPGATAP